MSNLITADEYQALVRERWTEEEFLRAVLALAKDRGWLSYHARPAMSRGGKFLTAVQGSGKGFPDLVLVRDSVVWAELKTATGRLRPEQAGWIAQLKLARQAVFLWRPADWATIERVLR